MSTITTINDGITGNSFRTQVNTNFTNLNTTKTEGAASSTDNAVARFDSITGKIVQNSGVIIDDSNNITGIATLDIGNADTTLSRVSAGRVAIEGDNIVTTSSTDTLTNKTLTTPNIASVKGVLTTDTDGATVTFNKNTSDFHNVVLGGNRTLALSNMVAGDRIVVRLTQDGTWNRTVTWFSTIKWAGGSVPTLTTTANKADMFGFLCTSAGNYDGFIIGQNI